MLLFDKCLVPTQPFSHLSSICLPVCRFVRIWDHEWVDSLKKQILVGDTLFAAPVSAIRFNKNTSNLSTVPTGIFRAYGNKQWNKQRQIVIMKTGVEVNESLHKDANHALKRLDSIPNWGWTAFHVARRLVEQFRSTLSATLCRRLKMISGCLVNIHSNFASYLRILFLVLLSGNLHHRNIDSFQQYRDKVGQYKCYSCCTR